MFIDRNLMLEEIYELLLLNEKLKEIVAIRNLEHLPLLVLVRIRIDHFTKLLSALFNLLITCLNNAGKGEHSTT